MPTPPATTSADYEGWWTYTNAAYGFSLRLPPDWVVDETTTGEPLIDGHLLHLHPKTGVEQVNIRLTFRRTGEEILLWPTGVGEGEFIPHGTVEITGLPAQRLLLVCPSGQVKAIWYHDSLNEANFARGNLEFGIIFSYTGATCQDDLDLTGKIQWLAEMIISSLSVHEMH